MADPPTALRARCLCLDIETARHDRLVLREIVEAADDASVLGIRQGVKNGGCAGMSYTFIWM